MLDQAWGKGGKALHLLTDTQVSFPVVFFSPLLLQRACYFGAPLPSTASVLLLEDHGGLADCRPLHPV